MAKKFIINRGMFIMSASVELHQDLATDHTETKGGGYWHLDQINLYLYGTSERFGKASIEDLKKVFNEGLTPTRMQSWNIYYSPSDILEVAIATGIKIKSASIL